MLNLEPALFERHFLDFVNLDQLALQVDALKKSVTNPVEVLLIDDLLLSLQKKNGLLLSYPKFKAILNSDHLRNIFGISHYDYGSFQPCLSTTIDLFLGLNSIEEKLGTIDQFLLKTKDALMDEEIQQNLPNFFLSVPYSFGYEEQFFIVF